MSVTTTTEILTGLGTYLAAVALAQYRVDQTGYLDHPDLPAVLFGDADVPDTALALTVVGRNPDLGTWDIEFAYRTTGVTPFGVEGLADAVLNHFEAVMGQDAWTYEYGTVVARPVIGLGSGLEVVAIQLITRGTAEMTAEAKHKGKRFVRRDQYRLVVFDELVL